MTIDPQARFLMPVLVYSEPFLVLFALVSNSELCDRISARFRVHCYSPPVAKRAVIKVSKVYIAGSDKDASAVREVLSF